MVLYYAKAKGFSPRCLIFDYGQRHRVELKRASAIARQAGCPYRIVSIRLPWGASALLDKRISLPKRKTISPREIPVTYVPARNIIFLSFAASFAEAIGARAVFIGANAIDYSGYPDCRPAFIEAFERMANLATKAAVEGSALTVHAPLLHLSKAEIVQQGTALGVDYAQTVSCYQADEQGRACGACDSCRLRRAGFAAAGIPDPTPYRAV